MKTTYQLLTAVFGFLVFTAFTTVAPVTYTLDAAKSTVKWTGHAEAGGYSPSGILKLKSGSLSAEGTNVFSGKATVDMLSLSQENKQMETHLRGSDFFDCNKYPEAVFVITSVKGNMATGNLTIKGVTEQIAFPVNITKNAESLIVKAIIKVDRTKFGIKYNSKSYFQDLGSYAIKNEFDLEINLQFN